MTITEKIREVNIVNTIIAQAERQIYSQTGLRMRLITVGDISEEATTEVEKLTHIKLLQLIANSVGMQYSDYTEKNRRKNYVRLRMLGAILLKQYYPSITLDVIADLFKQDHTSVMHGLKIGNDLLSIKDNFFMEHYNNALSAITQYFNE